MVHIKKRKLFPYLFRHLGPISVIPEYLLRLQHRVDRNITQLFSSSCKLCEDRFVFLYLYTHKLESLKQNVSIYFLLNDIKCESLRAIMKIS